MTIYILTDEVPRQELEGLQNTVHPVRDQGEPDILSSRTRFLPLSDLLLHLKDKSLHMTYFSSDKGVNFFFSESVIGHLPLQWLLSHLQIQSPCPEAD